MELGRRLLWVAAAVRLGLPVVSFEIRNTTCGEFDSGGPRRLTGWTNVVVSGTPANYTHYLVDDSIEYFSFDASGSAIMFTAADSGLDPTVEQLMIPSLTTLSFFNHEELDYAQQEQQLHMSLELAWGGQAFCRLLAMGEKRIQVQGKYHNPIFFWADDFGSPLKVAPMTSWILRYLIQDRGGGTLFGGYGEELTRYAAMQARLDGKIMITAAAADTETFANSQGRLFGILPPAGLITKTLLAYLVDIADKVDRQTAAGVGESPCSPDGCRPSLVLGTLGSCPGTDLSDALDIFGRTAVGESLGSSFVDAAMVAALRRLAAAKVTVLKICGLVTAGVQRVTAAMEELNFDVYALSSDVASSETFGTAVRRGWRAGRHFFDVVAWHSDQPGVGESGMTSTDFFKGYVRDHGEIPSQLSAAQFTAFWVWMEAVLLANSTDADDVKDMLRTMTSLSFWGNLSFNENGQSTGEYRVTQVKSTFLQGVPTTNLLSPRHLSPDPDAWVLPRPTWAQVKCREETIAGKECHGQGVCLRSGACACHTGFMGARCESMVPEAEGMDPIVIVAIVIAALTVVVVLVGIVCFILVRRQRFIQATIAKLERALDTEDGTFISKAKSALQAMGWSARRVELTVTGMRKKLSEERGVSVAYLLSDEFLKLAQERSGLEDPTFYDLKHGFFFGDNALGKDMICPRDNKPGVALVDWLPKQYRSTCTHFLSWTWGYQVSCIRGALQHWLETSGESADEVFIFMCFFVNNQYRILVSQERTGAEELEHVFESNLMRIGKTIAVLDTWDNPKYLTRIWTIFEQATSIKLGVPVTMILPAEAVSSLLKEFDCGKEGINRVKDSLTTVDSKSAKAHSPEDEQAVKALIQRTCGFGDLDEQIVDFMVKWVGVEMQTHLRNLVVSNHASEVQQALARRSSSMLLEDGSPEFAN